MPKGKFRLGITADFLNARGEIGWGNIGLDMLDAHPEVTWEFLPPARGRTLEADVVKDFDGLLVLTPAISAETLREAERLILVARFGVGYDRVDVDACTAAGVLLTITPDGVRRPVAVAAVSLILGITHRLLIKDRLTREGRWNEKLDHMGTGLSGKVVGMVGVGNIGREVLRLLTPFNIRAIGYDPYVSPEALGDTDVKLTDLATLMADADVVCVTAALTPETHHLIGAAELTAMKGSSFLVNVGRGPIVDQRALTKVLAEGGIQGAALDVFEEEPISPDDPLLALENVILSPHATAWTDEIALGNGRSALGAVVDVASGRVPGNLVNPGALDNPKVRDRLQASRSSSGVGMPE